MMDANKIYKLSKAFLKAASLRKASGILFVCPEDSTCFLQLRSGKVSHGGTWATPGGSLESGESNWEAAVREIHEELGSFPECKKIGEKTHIADNFRYVTHICKMSLEDKKAWEPELNFESDDAKWFSAGDLPSNLLPAFKKAFRVKTAGKIALASDELDNVVNKLRSMSPDEARDVFSRMDLSDVSEYISHFKAGIEELEMIERYDPGSQADKMEDYHDMISHLNNRYMDLYTETGISEGFEEFESLEGAGDGEEEYGISEIFEEQRELGGSTRGDETETEVVIQERRERARERAKAKDFRTTEQRIKDNKARNNRAREIFRSFSKEKQDDIMALLKKKNAERFQKKQKDLEFKKYHQEQSAEQFRAKTPEEKADYRKKQLADIKRRQEARTPEEQEEWTAKKNRDNAERERARKERGDVTPATAKKLILAFREKPEELMSLMDRVNIKETARLIQVLDEIKTPESRKRKGIDKVLRGLNDDEIKNFRRRIREKVLERSESK